MPHVLAVNLALLILPICGASAFAFLVYRWLMRVEPPAMPDGPGGSKVPGFPAGPNDLARSA